jgi:predicted anti-sigma-YlaC factor YlaD
MNCNDTQNKLIFYIDGELSKSESSEIENHLDSCNNCNILYQKLKIDLSILSSERIMEIDVNFTESVMQNIRNIESFKISNRQKALNFLMPFAVAASIILIISVGILFGNMGTNKTSTQISGSESEVFYINDLEQESLEFNLINE